MPPLLSYFYVAMGGALGSVTRFWLAAFVTERAGGLFPWGTLVVNVTGSFAIGFLATISGPYGRSGMVARFQEFFMIGICGGYTTFSAFSLQTLSLTQQGELWKAAANILLSVAVCLIAVWLGHLLAVSTGAKR